MLQILKVMLAVNGKTIKAFADKYKLNRGNMSQKMQGKMSLMLNDIIAISKETNMSIDSLVEAPHFKLEDWQEMFQYIMDNQKD